MPKSSSTDSSMRAFAFRRGLADLAGLAASHQAAARSEEFRAAAGRSLSARIPAAVLPWRASISRLGGAASRLFTLGATTVILWPLLRRSPSASRPAGDPRSSSFILVLDVVFDHRRPRARRWPAYALRSRRAVVDCVRRTFAIVPRFGLRAWRGHCGLNAMRRPAAAVPCPRRRRGCVRRSRRLSAGDAQLAHHEAPEREKPYRRAAAVAPTVVRVTSGSRPGYAGSAVKLAVRHAKIDQHLRPPSRQGLHRHRPPRRGARITSSPTRQQ